MDHTLPSEHLEEGVLERCVPLALRGFSPWGPVGSVGGWTGVLQSVRLRAEASCPGLRAVWSPFFALIPVASMGCVPTLRALVLPTQLCHCSPLISHPLSPSPVSLGSFPCSLPTPSSAFLLLHETNVKVTFQKY